MNDKQKQIEETADILGYACPRRCDKCFQNNLCGATKLYNAGYRKIPENSMVITKAEYQQMCHLLASACKLIGTLHKENENG